MVLSKGAFLPSGLFSRARRLAASLAAAALLGAAFLSGCNVQWQFSDSGPASGLRPGAILINEAVSSNVRSLPHELLGSPDWIELYNPGGAAVNLEGCHLSDNSRDLRKWTFPSVTLEPGGYLLVYAAGYDGDLPEGVFCTDFGLSKDGESLFLTTDAFVILDRMDLPPLDRDVSYARDETGGLGYCGISTPGGPNTAPIAQNAGDVVYAGADASLVLSEAVPANIAGLQAEDGRRYPWAELHNTGSEPIRLLEFWLSDDRLDLLKWRLPDAVLRPGERAIVFFSDETGAMHASFRLGGADDSLYLSDSQGRTAGELHWELPMAEDIAVLAGGGTRRYTLFPTPGEPNSDVVFDRIVPAAMDETDPVVLSEALPRNRYSAADADGDRVEWVELYNRSGGAVSLSGYALSDDGRTPGKWRFPDVTIAPESYLLVFLSGKDRKEGELHASFRLSERDEAIWLTNLNGMRQDTLPLDPHIGENVSIGRADGETRYFATPTPGAQNDTAAFERLSAVPGRNPDGVFISEASALAPVKSRKADWIEFFNPTDSDVSLAGWGVSDSPDEPMRHEIAALTIPAGGYAVMYTSDRSLLRAENSGSFGLTGGETLFLTDPDGNLRDYFLLGALRAGMSSGRDESDPSGARRYFSAPSPGAKNGEGYPGYAAEPVFSRTELYHDSPFDLTLSCATPGARIHYTLDGGKPTAESPVYLHPLAIGQTTPVRAMAVADGLYGSESVSHTYLFEERHTLPVLCVNGENFASVNAAMTREQRVEREMHMEYFEPDGRLGIASACGLRAMGASTLTYRQKSFTLFFRGGYGRSTAAYPFFPGCAIREFTSLNIRNSGQDGSRARMRDSLLSRAVEGMHIENVATRPVVVYINGQYWGLYDLNENQNEDFLAGHYGVDPDAVDIIRRNVEARAGTNRDNKRVRAFGRGKDLSVQANFDEYAQWVDMDYVNDYLIAQSFFANWDLVNQKYWRSHDYRVKWRPVLYDLDMAMSGGSYTGSVLPSYFSYEGIPSQDGSLTNFDLFCGLRANAAWREQFARRYVEVLDTLLTPERLTSLLDQVTAEMEPEMERHIRRWGHPSSVSAWKNHVADLREAFEKRGSYALASMQRTMSISDAQVEQFRARPAA